MKPLTPTQKAAGTGTYFIRAKIWFPDGDRVELELPWVSKEAGDPLVKQLVQLVNHMPEKTAEEWEAEAFKGLEVRKKERLLKSKYRCLPVVKDTDWIQQPSSHPQRGIIDNAREIEFGHELSKEELQIAKEYLANDAYSHGKGWTGVMGYRTDARPGFVYRFTTTWDSSD